MDTLIKQENGSRNGKLNANKFVSDAQIFTSSMKTTSVNHTQRTANKSMKKATVRLVSKISNLMTIINVSKKLLEVQMITVKPTSMLIQKENGTINGF